MLLLAIDSATPVAGVALINNNRLLQEEFVNYKKTHSETLMPTIDKVLNACECRLEDLSALAVTIGPGSFTGLRIGLATVKGLSLAGKKPVVGVSTLDVLAHNLSYCDALVCPLLDARKQEVYTAFYDNSGCYPQRLGEEIACSPADFVSYAREVAARTGKKRFVLLGDGYEPYRDFFVQELNESLVTVPLQQMFPRASALASLAAVKLTRGETEDIFSLKPHYVRLSEAEYKLSRGEL